MAKVFESDPTVSTTYGEIEGFYYESYNGLKAEIFLGIPYAKPPIGDLRFEKPQPPSPWTSTLKAKEFGHQSATYKAIPVPNASEDSLTLNIMKPKSPCADPAGYPVMFFIHGGAFIAGSSANHPYSEIVDRLVSHGVIVITINYRLGPFGFFSSGDSIAPGNYGLWDQVEALKFIQKVISSFNGNPKNVTIFGASAGAASVSWLTLSPATKDLFAQAITMGGSAFALWAHSEEVVENSAKLAKAAGCADSKDIKECMKQKSKDEIISAAATFIKSEVRGDNVNFGYFYPRLNGEFVEVQTMAEAVKNAPKKTNFLGMCSQEYISFVLKNPYYDPTAKFLPISAEKAANFSRNDFIEILDALVATEKAYGTKAKEASKKIIEFYETQKFYHSNFYLQILAQLFSDIVFNVPAMREALLKAASGHEVYFFIYDFSPEIIKTTNKMEIFEGAGHGFDFANLFGVIQGGPAIDWEDPEIAKVQKTYVDLFVNFAKTGIPSAEGITVAKVTNDSQLPYLYINVDSEMKDNLWPDRLQFWDKMAKKYGFDWPEAQKIENKLHHKF